MPNDELKQLLLRKNNYKNTAFTLLLDKKCGFQRVRYQNQQTDARITALSLLLLDNRFDQELFIYLDFKDGATASKFFNQYLGGLPTKFQLSNLGALEEADYQSYKIRPLSYFLSDKFSDYGYDVEIDSNVKQQLKIILAAVQDFDPIDKINFNHLTDKFFLNMQNSDQQKFAAYKKFYYQGAMMKFFQQVNLVKDLGSAVVDYLDDENNRNIASLNHATHEEGMENLAKHFKP